MDEDETDGLFNVSTIILYTTAAQNRNIGLDTDWRRFNVRTNAVDTDGLQTAPTDHYEQYSKASNNYWALLALVLVFGTAAGNILVCLAIVWERRLQNVTNYFLMSLAMTDLMVAILVMPLGILTLVRGYFPLQSEHCLAWICLDVLFCTASIMHLCTISVDRYLSLRYPMRFGRNKTRRRVTLKIIFVWLLSIAMSLPLSLMYSKDHASVLVNGTCQIPDPVYKLVGSIVCFYIPLGVMLLTYCLTVQLLARQRQNLGGSNNNPSGWSSGWLGQAPAFERRCTWRKLLKTSLPSTPNHAHSGTSTETELSTLDTRELWLPDSSIPDPTPSTMTALHQFGAEMLKLSRGLESVATVVSLSANSSGNPFDNRPETTQNISKQYTVPEYCSNGEKDSVTSNGSEVANTRTNGVSSMVGIGNNANSITHSIPLIKSNTISTTVTTTTTTPTKNNNKYTSLPEKRTSTLMRGGRRRRASAAPYASTSDEKRPSMNYCEHKIRFNSLPRNVSDMLRRQEDTDSDSDERNDSGDDYFEKCELKSGGSGGGSGGNSSSGGCYDDINCSKNAAGKYLDLPPPCTCPYFGDRPLKNAIKPAEVKIVSTCFPGSSPEQDLISASGAPETGGLNRDGLYDISSQKANTCYLVPATAGRRKLSVSKSASVVTWNSGHHRRRGSSFGNARTSLLLTPTKNPSQTSPLRRSATLKHHNNMNCFTRDGSLKSRKTPSSPCLLQRNTTVRSHHSRNSSVISRNSSRHGRIIRLEQKATKVLGVVFFTFVILWAPFFVLNLLPTVCAHCEERISHWVFDVVTWLGYASSMVNPIFYTIFNKVFRQAFKKVLLCKYSTQSNWHPPR